ncbi:MAG TPA: hypothetical protein VLJ59_12310 [Mycobacteriales bacterium]|nr:hypothetical protein [Mycobacteriales bacterium]
MPGDPSRTQGPRLAAGAASNAAELAESLVVVPKQMRENLGLTGAAGLRVAHHNLGSTDGKVAA